MALTLGFEWRVALRFLREGRMQTALIIIGVAACVAVVAYISALINGLQSNTITKTLGAQSHLSVRAPDDTVLSARAPDAQTRVLALANVGDAEVQIDPLTLSGFARDAYDLVHDAELDLDEGLTLPPHGFVWVRVTPL